MAYDPPDYYGIEELLSAEERMVRDTARRCGRRARAARAPLRTAGGLVRARMPRLGRRRRPRGRAWLRGGAAGAAERGPLLVLRPPRGRPARAARWCASRRDWSRSRARS